MHELRLAHAVLPEPKIVLGILLRPYSLFHELILQKENSPLLFPSGSATATRAHLTQAVLICCQSFEEYRRGYFEFSPWLRLKLWAGRGTMRRAERRSSIRQESERFSRYRDSGLMALPRSLMPSNGREGREPGAPFVLIIHQFISWRKGLTDAAAWDYPAGLAIQNWQCYHEQEGALRIHNQAEEDARIETDKVLAEIAAEESMKGGS